MLATADCGVSSRRPELADCGDNLIAAETAAVGVRASRWAWHPTALSSPGQAERWHL